MTAPTQTDATGCAVAKEQPASGRHVDVAGQPWMTSSATPHLARWRLHPLSCSAIDEAAVAKRIFDWVADHEDLTLWFGRAARTGA